MATPAPVEHEVVVLVGRDARHQLISHRVVGDLAGVAMADTGGQLLSAGVHKDVDRTDGTGVITVGHGCQPIVLQLHRVGIARCQQVAAEGDRMLALFRSPQVVPLLEGVAITDM
jgi:hypothetical protein